MLSTFMAELINSVVLNAVVPILLCVPIDGFAHEHLFDFVELRDLGMESPGLGLSVGDKSLSLSNESDSAQDFHNDSLI